jgi:riboflavin synthase
MFTGLIEASGKLTDRKQRGGVLQLTLAAPALASRLRTGDSISVNGACLTALEIDAAELQFSADLAAETIERTTLSRLPIGAHVNLELPTPAGTPLGGHIVQGHVDGVGTITALQPVTAGKNAADTDWRLEIKLPPALLRYVVEKGSISVDGISLTVAALNGDTITVAILPHTYTSTNLHTLAQESEVNIEVDVLARYAEKLSGREKTSRWPT